MTWQMMGDHPCSLHIVGVSHMVPPCERLPQCINCKCDHPSSLTQNICIVCPCFQPRDRPIQMFCIRDVKHHACVVRRTLTHKCETYASLIMYVSACADVFCIPHRKHICIVCPWLQFILRLGAPLARKRK